MAKTSVLKRICEFYAASLHYLFFCFIFLHLFSFGLVFLGVGQCLVLFMEGGFKRGKRRKQRFVKFSSKSLYLQINEVGLSFSKKKGKRCVFFQK